MPKSIENIISEFTKKVKEILGDRVKKIILYGSYARGDYKKNSDIDIVTPGYRMKWDELDKMRKDKKETPFTGTTIIMNQSTNDAIWFSKNIIPVIRKEEKYD